MLTTSARLLRLLAILQARPFWAGPELASKLEVTDRTLRRDVDRLRALGYPVESSSGTAGGYRLAAGAKLPPLHLDDDEAVAVAMALHTAPGGSIAGLETAALRALVKLEQVFPKRLRRRLEALRNGITRAQDHGPTVAMDDVATLARACSEKLALAFAYRDHGGKESTRAVEPHRIVHTNGRWFLVAWDTARDDFRTFRVDRVRAGSIRETGARFPPRSFPEDDVAAYVNRSIASSPYRYKAEVVLHASLDACKQRVTAYQGVLEARTADTCTLHMGAHSLDGLAVLIAVIGVDFEVRSPEELRAYLDDVGKRLTRAACAPR